MRIVARFDVLEPRIVGAISPPDADLSLPFYDVHGVAVLIHKQFCLQWLNPLSGGALPIGRLPAGCNVEGDARPAQRKCCRRNRHSRHGAVKAEEELGAQLVNRTTRNVSLRPAGELFLNTPNECLCA